MVLFNTPAPIGMDKALSPPSSTAYLQPRQLTNVLPGDPDATAHLETSVRQSARLP